MADTRQAPIYTAEISYSEERIRRLTQTQYNCFSFGRKLLQALSAIVLIILGLFFGKSVITVLCLAVGCYLIVSLDYRAKSTAEAIIKQFNGSFPRLQYSFTETGIFTDNMVEETAYGKISKLVFDSEYLYIYFNQATAFMLSTASVSGEGGAEGLKSFISRKTAMKWIRPNSFANISLGSIVDFFRH